MTRFHRLCSLIFGFGVGLTGFSAHAEPLTVEEALARAIQHSPDLKAALADLDASRSSVKSAELQRGPVLYAGLNGRYGETFSDTSQGATRNSNQQIGGEVGVRGRSDFGTTWDVSVGSSARWQRVNRDPTTSLEVVLGPSVSADLSVSATQSLMRGAGESAVLAGVRQAQLSRDASVLARQRTASQLALDVLRTYWQLWVAEHALNVDTAALELTERQLADLKARTRIGVATEVDALRLESEAATRRQTRLESEVAVGNQQIALGRYLGLGATAALGLSASSQPQEQLAAHADVETLVAQASDASYDLAQLELTIAQARERVTIALNAARARLDLSSTLALGGLWTEEPPAGLALPGGRPAITAMVGLDFEFPLGQSSFDADLAQARATLESAKFKKDAKIDALTADIATAARTLDAAQARVRTATEAARLAQLLSEKEDQKLRLGTSVLTDLLSAQQAARSAELSRLRALADGATAALTLDHLSGALLDQLRLDLENPR